MGSLRIALAQLNLTVGDIQGNASGFWPPPKKPVTG